MAARLGALRDEDVRPGVGGVVRLREGLHLADQRRPRHADGARERTRIAERQHHRDRPAGERGVEQVGFLRKAPGDEPAADPRVAGSREFPLEPVRVAVAAADQPKAAGLAHGCGEPAVRDEVHRREQDRVFDPEQVGDTGPQSHAPLRIGGATADRGDRCGFRLRLNSTESGCRPCDGGDDSGEA